MPNQSLSGSFGTDRQIAVYSVHNQYSSHREALADSSTLSFICMGSVRVLEHADAGGGFLTDRSNWLGELVVICSKGGYGVVHFPPLEVRSRGLASPRSWVGIKRPQNSNPRVTLFRRGRRCPAFLPDHGYDRLALFGPQCKCCISTSLLLLLLLLLLRKLHTRGQLCTGMGLDLGQKPTAILLFFCLLAHVANAQLGRHTDAADSH